MVNFELYNPTKIIFGPGEVTKIGEEVKNYGKKAMLVSYSSYDFMKPLLEKVTTKIEAEGVSVVPFFKVVANPLVSAVEEAAEICRAEGIDVIVAVGGGSVLDTAKFIAASVDYKGDIWNMVESRVDEDTSVPPTTALPTVMISTIPGTASEMNCVGVISNEKLKEKAHLGSPLLYPKVSILDPELTCSLPPYQTACGIADAISHVMEVYLYYPTGAPMQQHFMDGIVETLVKNAPKVLENPNDIEARSQIQWAACVAWNGWTSIGINFTAPMHMMAHPLSVRYNATHGATLAVIMPAYMKYTYKDCPELYVMFAEKILGMDVKGKDQEEVALEAIEKFESFLKEIGVQTRLSEYDIKEADLDELVEDTVRVAFGADGTLAARKPLTKEDMKAILMLAL